MLVLIRNFFSPSDKSLLCRCGDVEVNPGPMPGGQQRQLGPVRQGEQDEHGDRDGLEMDLGRIGNVKCSKVQLQVFTQNVRGLGCSKKVRHLVNKCCKLCKNSNDSVFAFQETYVPSLDL